MKVQRIGLTAGTIRKVDIASEISDQESYPYLMSFAFDLATLKASIASVGLINPPILREGERGDMEVVTGYRRIRAAHELGIQEIQCMVVSCHAMNANHALLVAFYDNLATRSFNVIEKGLALEHLSRFHTAAEIVETYMPLMGLAKRKEVYEQYLRIQRRLTDSVKWALAKGKIQLKTAEILLEADEENIDIIYSYGKQLNLNANQWHQFVDMTVDLMKIEGVSARDLFDELGISSVIDQDIKNVPQQVNTVLDILRSRRYPKVTSTQKLLRRKFAAIEMPPGARIIPPPNLEGTEYKLEVLFKEGSSLRANLLKIANDPNLISLEPPLSEGLKVFEGHGDKKGPGK